MSADASRSGRKNAAVVVGLAAIGGWVLRDALLHGRVLFERDVHVVWYTQVEVFVHTVFSGAWPLWDPFLSFGQPMLANPNVQVLYPPTWLNLLIRPWTFYPLYALAHLVFGGAGVFALLRRLGVSRGGALLGGAVWMLSGPVLSVVNVWHHLAGAAWMGWVLLAAERATDSGRFRDALLWGAAAGLQILAGSPDACVETVLLQAAWLAPRVEYRRLLSEANRRMGRAALLALLFAAALAAGQWMPSLEAARQSKRSALSVAERTTWSYPPMALPGLVLPAIPVGLPMDATRLSWVQELRLPFLRSAYLGLPAFALVLAALTRRGPARKVAVIGAVMILLALGRHAHVYELAVTLIPPLKSLRFPEKFLVVVALCWASLAAIGFDAWRERARLPTLRVVLLAALIGIAAVSAVVLWQAPNLIGQRVLEHGASAAQVLTPVAVRLGRASVCGMLVLALLFWTRRHPPTVIAAGALALIVVWDLAAAHDGLNPMGPRDVFTLRPPLVDALAKDNARRLYVWDYFTLGASARPDLKWGFLSQQAYLRPPLAGRWDLGGSFDRDVLGLYPERLAQFVDSFQALPDKAARLRLLQVAGVDHVVALQSAGLENLMPVAEVPGFLSEPIRVFRVPDALPRAYLVGAARNADGPEAMRILLDPGFNPREEVLLLPGAGAAPLVEPLHGSVTVVSSQADRLRLVAETDRPGWVVILDSFDDGWKARVDGQSAPVQRANMIFRAVAIGSGRHEIELVYRPTSAIVGLCISATATLAGLVALVASRRRRSPIPERA